MGFEIYHRSQHINPRATGTFVRISRGVRICFSKPCAEFLGSTKYVLYLIDREKKMVGIKPCGELENGYRLHNQVGQAYCSAKTFLQLIGLSDTERIDVVIADGMIQFSYAPVADPIAEPKEK